MPAPIGKLFCDCTRARVSIFASARTRSRCAITRACRVVCGFAADDDLIVVQRRGERNRRRRRRVIEVHRDGIVQGMRSAASRLPQYLMNAIFEQLFAVAF